MTMERRLKKLEQEEYKRLEAVWVPLYEAASDRCSPDDLDGLEWTAVRRPVEQVDRESAKLNAWANTHGLPFEDESEALGAWLWEKMGRGQPEPAPEGAAASYLRLAAVWREAAGRPDCPEVPLARYVVARLVLGAALAEVIT